MKTIELDKIFQLLLDYRLIIPISGEDYKYIVNPNINEEERRRIITEMFEKHGIET